MQSIGKTPDTLGGSALPMVGSVIASLMTAVGISIIFSLVGVDSLSAGIGVGVTLGLLIVFPALLSDNLFCGWGKQLLLIQAGYRVVSIFLMSLALVFVG